MDCIKRKMEGSDCISRKALSFRLLCGEKRYYSCKKESRKTDILRLFLQWFKTTYLKQWEKLQREEVDIKILKTIHDLSF